MADPPAAVQICLECKKAGTLRCGDCHTTFYCSKDCQRASWKLHKILCKTFKDFQDRPTADGAGEKYIRAMYFHPDESVPRWTWLLTERLPVDDDEEPLVYELYPRPGTLLANEEKEGEVQGKTIYMAWSLHTTSKWW